MWPSPLMMDRVRMQVCARCCVCCHTPHSLVACMCDALSRPHPHSSAAVPAQLPAVAHGARHGCVLVRDGAVFHAFSYSRLRPSRARVLQTMRMSSAIVPVISRACEAAGSVAALIACVHMRLLQYHSDTHPAHVQVAVGALSVRAPRVAVGKGSRHFCSHEHLAATQPHPFRIIIAPRIVVFAPPSTPHTTSTFIFACCHTAPHQVGSFSLEFRALSAAVGGSRHACIADAMQVSRGSKW